MNTNRRHQLRLIGITYNQIESGVYALVLEEIGGLRRIPIIIGYPEAQSIECKLQEVVVPRPLTHDLLKNILDSFGLHLNCVEIYRLPNGVFAANLVLEGPEGEIHTIDSRSSDAIALAIRTDSPIYTSDAVIEEAGFLPDAGRGESSESGEEESASGSEAEGQDKEKAENLDAYSDAELRQMILRLAEEEKYEEGARGSAVLSRRCGDKK